MSLEIMMPLSKIMIRQLNLIQSVHWLLTIADIQNLNNKTMKEHWKTIIKQFF